MKKYDVMSSIKPVILALVRCMRSPTSNGLKIEMNNPLKALPRDSCAAKPIVSAAMPEPASKAVAASENCGNRLSASTMPITHINALITFLMNFMWIVSFPSLRHAMRNRRIIKIVANTIMIARRDTQPKLSLVMKFCNIVASIDFDSFIICSNCRNKSIRFRQIDFQGVHIIEMVEGSPSGLRK